MIQDDKIGKIITFYSFKGGVGRSMALSNIACLLSKWSKSILIVDFDLEAPGIEKYFTKTAYSYQKDGNEIIIEKNDIDFVFNQNNRNNYGVVDILTSISNNGIVPSWKDYLFSVSSQKHNIKCDILPAGKDNIDFASNLQSLNWDYLFTERKFSEIIEQLRNEWKKSYDFVLIDSRTGISDIGGICTIYLPDILAFLFTTNEASLNGCIDVVQRAKASRNNIPYDRSTLITIPIPSRDESKAEFETALRWKEIFALQLSQFYLDWLPSGTSVKSAIDILKIPYIPYWSFGDRLPVLEEGTSENSIGYSYEKIAQLISGDFDWKKVKFGFTTEDIENSKRIAIEQELGKIKEGNNQDKPFISKTLDEHLDSNSGPKKILSLDGGGVRSAITLGYLKKIETILREKYNKPELVLSDYFDLIGGTSSGSFIAACLAIGKSVDDVKHVFREYCERAFSKERNWWNPLETIKFFKATYDNRVQEEVLKRIFGPIVIGGKELKTGLCIITKRADVNKLWPIYNHPSGKYFDSLYGGNKNMPIWKAVLASSASPTYFEPQIIELDDQINGIFIDGGLSMANNPALNLMMLSVMNGFPFHWELGEDKLTIVSVGTGESDYIRKIKDIDEAWLATWMSTIPDILMHDASLQNQTMLQWFSKSPTAKSIDSEIGSLKDEFLAGKPLLKYLRYNLTLSKEELLKLNLPYLQVTEKLKDELMNMSNSKNTEILYRIGVSASAEIENNHFS